MSETVLYKEKAIKREEIEKQRKDLDRHALGALRDFQDDVARSLAELNSRNADIEKKRSRLQIECEKSVGHSECRIGGCPVCEWPGSPA